MIFKKKVIDDIVDECRGRYRQQETEQGYVCIEKKYCSSKEQKDKVYYCRYIGIFDTIKKGE